MKLLVAGAVILAVAGSAAASAQDAVTLVDVVELSGPGATVGTNFKNGADLAVAEINAAGGLLGHPLAIVHLDTQTNPGVARAAVQKALDGNPYAILGPGYSGSVKATAPLVAQAGIAQVTGGEGAELTRLGYGTLFRTSFGQQSSMPKIARYLAEDVKARSVAILWVNNDFGKGGRDMVAGELRARGVKVVADVSTEAGQADFAADVVKLKNAAPDAVFVYLNEEESARALKELRRQNVTVPLVGETTLLGQKVIELAGDAANGARGHVGLSVDAPVPALQAYGRKFLERYHYVPDHNGIKGYIGVYMIKAATAKMGRLDARGLPDALRGLTIRAATEPGILIDVAVDEHGDLDRDSFMAQVVDGRQVIDVVLPRSNPDTSNR